MSTTKNNLNVYLEEGSTHTFAGSVDWPGWCRSGRDEKSALKALLSYKLRYGIVLLKTNIGFVPPSGDVRINIVERLKGGAGTDYGAPEKIPTFDYQPVNADDLIRLQTVLRACWLAFDDIAQDAVGKELRLGPRGGGRQFDKILWHVIHAESAYLSRLGGKFKTDETGNPSGEYGLLRQAVLETLNQAANGEIPTKGPRGGLRWTPRYFVRRTAWHILDHAWEIQDRLIE
jgi:hypothetical protein